MLLQERVQVRWRILKYNNRVAHVYDFHGIIDEASICNVALTENDIRNLMKVESKRQWVCLLSTLRKAD